MYSTDRNRFQKDAEARLPLETDIAAAYRLPWSYADMLAWCRENVAGAWSGAPMDWNRSVDNGAPWTFPVAFHGAGRR